MHADRDVHCKISNFLVILLQFSKHVLQQILCGNLTGWVNIFELHMIFRCLSALCCGLMYTAGGLICEIRKIEISIVFLICSLSNLSYRYHQWKIQSNSGLHVRTVLEYRNHVVARNCKLLVKFHSLVHGDLVPHHPSDLFVPINSKFSEMADPKRSSQWSQGSVTGSSTNKRKNRFFRSWLGETATNPSSSCLGGSTRVFVLGNVERSGEELDCSSLVLGDNCKWH